MMGLKFHKMKRTKMFIKSLYLNSQMMRRMMMILNNEQKHINIHHTYLSHNNYVPHIYIILTEFRSFSKPKQTKYF